VSELPARLGVVDTTVLNNFAQVRQPALLCAAFSSLAAPKQVLAELEKGVGLGLLPSVDWSWLDRIDLTPAEQVRARVFGQKVEAGESACLAVAEARRGFVLTDDLAARRLALTISLTVTGTLGALDRLIRAGILTVERADDLLAEMILRGYRSPVPSVRHFYSR
jgi:predicted nucleic acid-binding protein